jgi:hypothetical protein
MAAHKTVRAPIGVPMWYLAVYENATNFFKEKVLGTDNSGCCFWWGRKPSLGEVKES